MPKLLTDINIAEITLCKAGKNGLQFIAKAADGFPRIEVAIRKTDPIKKVAVGVVYEPEKPDAEGDMATAAEIEKAAWSALKNHAVVNKAEHGSAPVGAYLAESYIVKAGDPDGFPAGAWAAVVKVEDEALWAEIEKGEIAAFSMGGVAKKVPVADPPAEPAEKSVHADTMVFADNFADALKVLQAIAGIMEGVTKQAAADSSALKASLEALPAQIDALGKKVEAGQVLVQNIAEAATDGRVTSPTPGSAAGIDPTKY